MNIRMQEICVRLYNTAPAFDLMKGNPDFENWGRELISLSQIAELSPLKGVLVETVNDALITLDSLNQFIAEQANQISIDVYLQASQISESEIVQKRKPYAAFILSWIALSGWSFAAGDNLYMQFYGLPYRGWESIPYSCALGSVKLDGFDAAKHLVEQSYDVLKASKYEYDFEGSINRYRNLAQQIKDKYEIAISNLVEDLYSSCYEESSILRMKFSALVWSLGLIPESLSLSLRHNSIRFSQQFFKRVVEQSLDLIFSDPLIQYVWLEIKDYLPLNTPNNTFNLRDHKSIFKIINIRYSQFFVDEIYPLPPSRVYAQTLISYLQGNLNEDQATEYISMYEDIKCFFPERMDWSVFLRMRGLAHTIAKKFNWLPIEFTDDEEKNLWCWLVDMAKNVREASNLHPERPEIYSRMSLGLFHLIENEFYKISNSSSLSISDLENIVSITEKFRTSALSYWLQVTPPLVSRNEQDNIRSLLDEERQLIEYIRGSYFLTLFPLLPRHYRRYAMVMEDMMEAEKHAGGARLDPDLGRQQLEEIGNEMNALFLKMQPDAPEYTQKRIEASASISKLFSALRNHSLPPKN